VDDWSHHCGHGSSAFRDTTRCLHRAGIPPEGITRGMAQFTFAPDPSGTR